MKVIYDIMKFIFFILILVLTYVGLVLALFTASYGFTYFLTDNLKTPTPMWFIALGITISGCYTSFSVMVNFFQIFSFLEKPKKQKTFSEELQERFKD